MKKTDAIKQFDNFLKDYENCYNEFQNFKKNVLGKTKAGYVSEQYIIKFAMYFKHKK